MAEIYTTSITRSYIDIRPLLPPSSPIAVKPTPPLPLLTTLQPPDQTSITRYRRPQDQFMSLASTLLKYHFIHTTCRVPWSAVHISRWPKPHQRPYWSPPSTWHGEYGIEFNVSHQGGLVVLIGCRTPRPLGKEDLRPDGMVASRESEQHATRDERSAESSNGYERTATTDKPLFPPNPRLGVDISFPSEPHRSPSSTIHTPTDLYKWIDVFSEMFSDSERDHLKYSPITTELPLAVMPGSRDELHLKLRRFYTHWALKEAFIKMVGEGLLAEWLRRLEFRDVAVPIRVVRVAEALSEIDIQDDDGDGDGGEDSNLRHGQPLSDTWSEPHSNLTASLYDRTIVSSASAGATTIPEPASGHNISMSLATYGTDFIVAECRKDFCEPPFTLPSGQTWLDATQPQQRWVSLDIERDIRPCAEGRCGCLDTP